MGKHRKSEPIGTTALCKHGCGNVAKFKTPSGLLLCESVSTKCPAIRAKNSAGLKLAYENNIKRRDVYSTLPKEVKDRMAHSRGKTADNYEPIRKWAKTRHENFLNGKWIPTLRGVGCDPSKRWKRNKFEYYDSSCNHCILESWNELKLANELDKHSVRWIRPSRFKLSDGKYYEPDFYLVDYNVYLDPKAKFFGTRQYLGYTPGEDQTEKISRFEIEYGVRVIILWQHEKNSLTWSFIKMRL